MKDQHGLAGMHHVLHLRRYAGQNASVVMLVARLRGASVTLHGRSLLFVRNVGHLMTNPAILLPDGSENRDGCWL